MVPDGDRHAFITLQFYRLLHAMALAAIAPVLPFLDAGSRRVKEGFYHFLGQVPSAIRPVLWVHGVSMGEALVASGFAAELKKQFPQFQIAFTTTHPDVYCNVKKRQMADLIAYFPLDNALSMQRVFERWRPAAVFVAETDFWPEFSWQCQRRSVPLVLINGRISDKIARFYTCFGSFADLVFSSYSLLAVQTESDRQKLLKIGVVPEKIAVLGNMKADLVLPTNVDVKAISAWLKGRRCLVFGSLHPSEFAILKPVILKLAKQSDTAVIVAPRNPSMCATWKKELDSDACPVKLRSSLAGGDGDTGLLLLDTMGELAAVYAVATVAFVGGSLDTAVGGHNPLEVIQQHVPLVMGPHCRNFSDIIEQLKEMGGITLIADRAEAEESIGKLLANLELASRQVQAADRVLSLSTGCLQRTLEHIRPILQQRFSGHLY